MSHDIYTTARGLADRLPGVKRMARGAVPAQLRSWLYRRHFHKTLSASGDPRQVFQQIYDLNWWNSAETRSGPGSELAATATFRKELSGWLARHTDEVRTLLDAPCGDFNWMRYLALPETTRYIGGDIVPDLIRANTDLYAREGRSFLTLDIVTDAIPDADAWLCRDVLFHLPYAMGQKVCAAFLASNTRYFLSTTFPDAVNGEDIPVGWYRPVNLEQAPFNLGKPVELLADPSEDDPRRFVGVWKNPRFS